MTIEVEKGSVGPIVFMEKSKWQFVINHTVTRINHDTRRPAQQIKRVACVTHDGAAKAVDGIIGPVARHLHDGRSDNGFLEPGNLRFHLDGTDSHRLTRLIHCLVTHMTDTGNDLFTLNGNDKNAAGVAHAVGEQGGIPRIHHDDVGILQWSSFLINETTDKTAVGLVGTFHIDLTLVVDGHGDRVEADELTDGIGDAFASHVGSDTEVLEFVEDEHDAVTVGLALQILQRLAHRDPIEAMGNLLCIDA